MTNDNIVAKVVRQKHERAWERQSLLRFGKKHYKNTVIENASRNTQHLYQLQVSIVSFTKMVFMCPGLPKGSGCTLVVWFYQWAERWQPTDLIHMVLMLWWTGGSFTAVCELGVRSHSWQCMLLWPCRPIYITILKSCCGLFRKMICCDFFMWIIRFSEQHFISSFSLYFQSSRADFFKFIHGKSFSLQYF